MDHQGILTCEWRAITATVQSAADVLARDVINVGDAKQAIEMAISLGEVAAKFQLLQGAAVRRLADMRVEP